MLATGMVADRGVYALLLGSGVSSAAGVPTGWQVVTELVRHAAAAQAPDDPDAAEQAASDPEGWWSAHGDGTPLGYSALLGALAPTPAGRRALLARFFEPSEEDRVAGLKVPTKAHQAVAELVREGFVRVILTTNFDRLTERSLEDVGVSPQVISRPAALSGLTPLQHVPVTVIKIHGDYADLAMRNTVEELSSYPKPWERFLERVLDEHGLVISGWSAEWDTALVRVLQRVRQRRYALYWESRSAGSDAAGALLAQHRGVVITSSSADELFSELRLRVAAVASLSEAPVTTATSVATLKRLLPDPVRHIELHDLVMGTADRAVARIRESPVSMNHLDGVAFDGVLTRLAATAAPLVELLSSGVFHDRDRSSTELWCRCLGRVMEARSRIDGRHQQLLDQVRHYPALLGLRAAGLAAVLAGRDDVLVRLLTEPTWRNWSGDQRRQPAIQALHDHRVLSGDFVNALPRWEGTKWTFPLSHLLRTELRDVFRDFVSDDQEYSELNDRYEYRVGLAQFLHADDLGFYRSAPGEFIGDWRWSSGIPAAESEFREVASRAPEGWVWHQLAGGSQQLEKVLDAYRDDLQKISRLG